jgi:hypothetical protein
VTLLSLNVPVPSAVAAVADDLAPVLTPFDRVRDDHTFVLKRLTTDSPDPHRLREQARTALADFPPVRARIDGLDVFECPPSGPAPVLYLAVDSPGLVTMHRTLVDTLGAVEGLEGADYTPHVTLARGGDLAPATVDRICERPVSAVEWTVDHLLVYDAGYDEVAARLSLPP